MSRYNFKFGDNWISELGAVSTETPGVEIAQRDVSMIDIPGKDGSDCIDNGRYENVEISRSISLIGRRNFPIQDKAANFISAYAYLQGYQDFEDTDHNDMVTQAVLTNFDEVNRKMRTLHTATLKFSRKPFWYLKSALEFKEPDMTPEKPTISFNNPFPIGSKPLIIIHLTQGDPVSFRYRITANGESINYTYSDVPVDSNHLVVMIDCETKTVTLGEGSYLKYLDVDLPEEFGIGRSEFSLRAGKERVSQVLIAPRWRCL